MPHPANSEFKVPEIDLWEFLFEKREIPCENEKVLFVDVASKQNLTFGEIKDEAQRFGQGLKDVLGWQPGDVVAIMSTNVLDVPLVMCGTHYAGGAVVIINPNLSVDNISYQLCNSKAKLLFVVPEALGVGREVAAQAALQPEQIFVLGHEDFDTQKTWKSLQRDYESSITTGRKVLASDIAFIWYTSGTTGPRGKGAIFTHTNVVSNLLQRREFDTTSGPNDHILSQFQWSTGFGVCSLLLHPFFTGMTNFVLEKYDFVKQLEAIQEYKITYLWTMPLVVSALAYDPVVQNFDLSSVRVCFSTGSPCAWATVQAVHKACNIRIMQVYGQTETQLMACNEPSKDEDWEDSCSRVGKPLPYLEAKIIDPQGKEVPTGESGELVVRGQNTTVGYLGNPVATAGLFTSDGYIKTGDFCYFDDQGRIYLRDRITELVPTPRGFIVPTEMEAILAAHPAVAEVVVVCTKNLGGKLVAKAFVVLKSTELSQKEELVQLFTGKDILPNARLEGGITFLEKIPTNALGTSGKVLRRILAALPPTE